MPQWVFRLTGEWNSIQCQHLAGNAFNGFMFCGIFGAIVGTLHLNRLADEVVARETGVVSALETAVDVSAGDLSISSASEAGDDRNDGASSEPSLSD